jgi:hypothetical protein
VFAVVIVLVVAACSGSGAGDTTITTPDGSELPTLQGPLCEALPQGDDPGGPALLVVEPADVALTWIPVLTNFEAGVRAAGLDTELNTAEGVTILAPTDDAFTSTFTQDTLDDLLLFRQDEFGALLEAHIVEGEMTVAELIEAGTVTTVGGDTITVTAAGDMARFDDRAETLCADYQVANATIHVIDGVLGDLPAPADPADFDGN